MQDAGCTPTAELDGIVCALLADIADEVAILTSDEAGPEYCRDWFDQFGVAAPVVRPRTPEAMAKVVKRLASAGIRMVPQGGRTGLVGGGSPLGEEVVLSTELLREIERFDIVGATMTVQAGVPLQSVQEEAERHGLFYPIDTGARGSCFIGGTIATNAGGNRVLQYGATRESILGLEVVLADGSSLSMMGEIIKDNTGYDLKHLLIGSEGTLGIVTRAVLRLQPLPLDRVTLLIGFDDLEQVFAALVAFRNGFGPGLTSFEVMWRDFVEFAVGDLSLGRDPFGSEAGILALLEISLFGTNADAARDHAMEIIAGIAERLGEERLIVAQSLKEAAEFWTLRDCSGEIARAMGTFAAFDVSIPASRLTGTIHNIEQSLTRLDPTMRRVFYGHIGDGNLHIIAQCDEAMIEAVDDAVYEVVKEAGGSISAEHGIGMAKRSVLAKVLPETQLELMRRIKRALDPAELLNRGRIVAS